MNRYLKIGVATGVAFGGAMAASAYERTGNLAAVLINAAGGVLFGLAMMGTSWYGSRILKAKGITATDLNPVQTRQVHFPGPLRDALSVAREALSTLTKVKRTTESSTPPSLRVKTGFTFRCPGEHVVLEFRPTVTGTAIVITSKPRLWTIEMDMGKGVENVETIAQYIRKRSDERRVA